jgi:hypothetical protein
MGSPPMPRVVVCAANRNQAGSIVCGARHYDDIMRAQIAASTENWRVNQVEQGFIDQRGTFMSREEAWKVACDQGQIVRRVGGDNSCLYSENLY